MWKTLVVSPHARFTRCVAHESRRNQGLSQRQVSGKTISTWHNLTLRCELRNVASADKEPLPATHLGRIARRIRCSSIIVYRCIKGKPTLANLFDVKVTA